MGMGTASSKLLKASAAGDVRKVRALLLQDEADVNAQDKEHGATALHIATVRGHIHVVQALLDAGANAHATDEAGKTPLDYAIDFGHANIVAMLLDGMHTDESVHSVEPQADAQIEELLFSGGSSSDWAEFQANNDQLRSPDASTAALGIWKDPDLLAVRIVYREIEPIKLLSRGGFSEIWLGLYMNENVAIKRLLSDKKTMTDVLAIASEVRIMARLDHHKVVRLIGVAWTNVLNIQAVIEYMEGGDLRSLLDSSHATSLTWANLKCQIAIDVADALVYLHSFDPQIIHRDLKSRNVLIDASTGAKLSGFGLSRKRSVVETMTAGVDIYSFGVLLSELDTTELPFHDVINSNGAKIADVTILHMVSTGKLQPSFKPTCPEPIVKFARECLSLDPSDRPSAVDISYRLRKIMEELNL